MVKNNQETFEFTENSVSYTDVANSIRDWQKIDDRNSLYTSFLIEYYNYIINILEFKKMKRIQIYRFSLAVLSVPMIGIVMTLCVLVQNDLSTLGNLVALITTLGTVISTIIIMPAKIGEYLFNNDDTQQMVEIIKNIQDYDKNVRVDMRERKKNEETVY